MSEEIMNPSVPGPVEMLIARKLTEKLLPVHLEIENESKMHGLPRAAEKHFKVVVVSEVFLGQSRVARHRMVHDILSEELKERVHALSVQAFSSSEWESSKGKLHSSPECLGGGKHEKKF